MSGELKFKADATVEDIAKAIHKDVNTVRFLMREGIVDWGTVYKRKDNCKKLSYLVNAKKFFADTGILL